jgi:hypothetical protein
MYNSQDSLNKTHTYIQSLRAKGHSYGKYSVYNVTKDDLSALMDLTSKYGIPFEWMVNLINFESGRTFNPAIQNSIGATGLIQILPSTARGLGTTTDELKNMSFQQYLKYLDKYIYNMLRKKLTPNGKIPKNFTQGDLFMTIFYPVAVGNPDFIFPENVRKANAGISKPYDYTEKALKVSVFPLSVFPYSLEDVKHEIKSNPVGSSGVGMIFIGCVGLIVTGYLIKKQGGLKVLFA